MNGVTGKPERRSCDHPDDVSDGHSSPCFVLQQRLIVEAQIFEQLQEIVDNQQKMMTEQKEMYEAQKTMMDLLNAWNDAKGFVKTSKVVGKLILGLVAVGTAIYALGDAFRHWVLMK